MDREVLRKASPILIDLSSFLIQFFKKGDVLSEGGTTKRNLPIPEQIKSKICDGRQERERKNSISSFQRLAQFNFLDAEGKSRIGLSLAKDTPVLVLYESEKKDGVSPFQRRDFLSFRDAVGNEKAGIGMVAGNDLYL